MPPGFRGVWVTAKHRAQLKLPLSSRLKGPSVPLMQKHLGSPNETWDSLGSHVILLAVYWISWDFLGIYWHLLDFMGYYWHLIYLLFIVKNHTLLAIYYYILDFTGFDGFYQEKCRAGPPKHGDSTKKKRIVAAVHAD